MAGIKLGSGNLTFHFEDSLLAGYNVPLDASTRFSQRLVIIQCELNIALFISITLLCGIEQYSIEYSLICKGYSMEYCQSCMNIVMDMKNVANGKIHPTLL